MINWILGGGLVAIIGLILANNREQDAKLNRSYERLDETKDYQDATFTRKDICAVLHKQIDEKLDRMDVKLDKILQNGSK